MGVKKLLGLRIFEDADGKMNLPIGEKMGILVVSQFTLHANLKMDRPLLIVPHHLH